MTREQYKKEFDKFLRDNECYDAYYAGLSLRGADTEPFFLKNGPSEWASGAFNWGSVSAYLGQSVHNRISFWSHISARWRIHVYNLNRRND